MKARPYQQQLSIYEGHDKDQDKRNQVNCDERAGCLKQNTGPDALCLKGFSPMEEGFKFASCALSFFRTRQSTAPPV